MLRGRDHYLDIVSHTLLDGGRDELGVEEQLVDLHGHDEEVSMMKAQVLRATMKEESRVKVMTGRSTLSTPARAGLL